MITYLKNIAVKHFFQKTDITATAKLHTGDKLRVDLSSSVGRSIWLRHFYKYEIDVENTLRDILRKGDVFIDIGANVGYFSVIASRIVGENGKVYSLEAIPRLCGLLSESAAINDIKNINILNYAAYSENKTISFNRMKNSAFSHISKDNSSDSTIEVNAITLDSLIDKVKKVDVVKIDVEGTEMNVLMGGEKLIRRYKPKIVMEVVDWSLQRFNYSSKDVLSFLRGIGYKVYDLKGNLIKSDIITGDQVNFLFVFDKSSVPNTRACGGDR